MKLCDIPLVDREGNINHEYFADSPGAHWSENDQDMLLQGIEMYGIGSYEKINKNLLPMKSVIEIRLRTCMLLGVHNLEELIGFKDTSKIAEIRHKNLAVAKKCGKLKYGMYLNEK